jgi:hypothetical protein
MILTGNGAVLFLASKASSYMTGDVGRRQRLTAR